MVKKLFTSNICHLQHSQVANADSLLLFVWCIYILQVMINNVDQEKKTLINTCVHPPASIEHSGDNPSRRPSALAKKKVNLTIIYAKWKNTICPLWDWQILSFLIEGIGWPSVVNQQLLKRLCQMAQILPSCWIKYVRMNKKDGLLTQNQTNLASRSKKAAGSRDALSPTPCPSSPCW